MGKICLTAYLLVLGAFDCRECKVPLCLVNGGLMAALVRTLFRCVQNTAEWKWIVLATVLGAVPGALVLGAGYITGKIGCGDGLVLMGLGMMTGYRECLVLISFSLLLMSGWCIGVLCFKRGNRSTRIPYIPFLAVVYILSLFVQGG